MKRDEALELIKSETMFWSRIGFGLNPPVLDENGEETFHETLEENIRYCKQVVDAGAKILVSNLPTGWVGIDKYDYRATDKTLDMIFKECPDVYYIPRIKINPPFEWQKDNPDELYIYEWAKFKDSKEISECVGTSMQDGTGAIDKTRWMGHQSFSSIKWKNDASVALRRIIEHLENSPYADRIIGYHIGYGKCGETHFWGDSADFGKTNKREFYKFGLDKYKTVEELSDAWGRQEISPENVPLPTNEKRYNEICDLDSFFHMGDVNILYRDYNEFRRKTAIDLLETFCKIPREMTGKLVGFFHGYIMHSSADYCGHTDLEEALDCENVDYFAAPKSYYRSEFQEPGGSYCAPMSVNRKKLWVDEIDVRTHKAKLNEKKYNATETFEQSKWVLWREFAKNEMSGSAYWYMDLGPGWYDDENILEEMNKIINMRKKLSEKKHESIAEILVVVDEENEMQTTQNYNFHIRALQDSAYEAAMIGAPYDFYRQKDLGEIDLSKYKLVIFLNAFSLKYDEFVKFGFLEDTYFIWNYAPGYINSDIEKLTGMKIKETGLYEQFPYIEIVPDDSVEVLENYDEKLTEYVNIPALENVPKKGIKTAIKEKNVLVALPSLNRNLIRKIAEMAGCNFYAPPGSIVYADNRFEAVFSEKGFEFNLKDYK